MPMAARMNAVAEKTPIGNVVNILQKANHNAGI
jgi:hypothetical protein